MTSSICTQQPLLLFMFTQWIICKEIGLEFSNQVTFEFFLIWVWFSLFFARCANKCEQVKKQQNGFFKSSICMQQPLVLFLGCTVDNLLINWLRFHNQLLFLDLGLCGKCWRQVYFFNFNSVGHSQGTMKTFSAFSCLDTG